MHKKALLLSISLMELLNLTFCASYSYDFYHNSINKAERHYFVDGRVDSALIYYNIAFDNFDFIFVKDLVNAAQVAFFNNLPFEHYLIRAFEFGLKMEHLHAFPLLADFAQANTDNATLLDAYHDKRKAYLGRINFDYLLMMYKLVIQDQVEKNKLDKEYGEFKRQTIYSIREYIGRYGFPGVKRLGIDDSSIFEEIGHPQYDIDSLKSRKGQGLSYLALDNKALSSKPLILLLIHNQCSFVEMEALLRQAVLDGEIHPREVGMIYDNMFRNGVNGSSYRCSMPKPDQGLFRLNAFCDYQSNTCSVEMVNTLRRKWFVVDLEVDDAKKQYEQLHGFVLFHGFWKCM